MTVHCSLADASSTGPTLYGQTVDISLSGLKMAVAGRLSAAEGDIISLVITSAWRRKPIQAKAEVCWVCCANNNALKLGLRFVDMNMADWEHWFGLIPWLDN